MIIAVASGKGGTGKTTVAVNLALSLSNVQLLDADVEEPNANVFLQTSFSEQNEVTVRIPKINEHRCDFCGSCADFCSFNAIAVVKEKVLVFPELCHACTGCALVCQKDAVEWTYRSVGMVRKGKNTDGVSVVEGELNTGEAMAIPVIKAVKSEIDEEKIVLIDAPPGTSCPVIEAIEDADMVLLVTEPTPFGLHDLKLAVDVARKMNRVFGVVINRAGIGDDRVEEYCKTEDIPVLLRIPHKKRYASLYSNGMAFIKDSDELKESFQDLYKKIEEMVAS